MDGLDSLGADIGDGGLIPGMVQLTAGLVEGGINVADQQDAADKAKLTGAQKLTVAIKADSDAALAAARSESSASLHMKTAAQDAQAAKKAAAAQDAASVGMDDATTQKRIAAVQKALAAAQADAAKKPKEFYPAALVRAWQATLDKLQGGSGHDDGASSESWLTRRVVGPLPGYAVLVGVALLGIVAKKFLVHSKAH